MNLHQQFLQLAAEKNKITYKLLALLPEIYDSGLYKKYTRTIYGYAWKFAQIPESTVEKTLRLQRNLVNRPLLKNAIKEVGVHKVAMVAKIATEKNEAILVEKLRTMSFDAVQQLSKELRNRPIANESLHFNLSPELSNLWKIYRKMFDSEISNEELLKRLLLSELPEVDYSDAPSSRHVPNSIRADVFDRFGGKCAHPDCNNSAVQIHHVERYAATRNHKKLLPLCRVHHEFVHSGLILNEENILQWQTGLKKVDNPIDQKYLRFKPG